MTLSEKSHDPEENSRRLAWEEKNRRQDRIAEKRTKLVFVAVAVILLISLLYVLRQVRERHNLVEKRPTVACQWRIDPLRYCLECGKSLKPAEIDEGQENYYKMPLSGNWHSFDSSSLKTLKNIGAVYGLLKTDLPFRPDHYNYVGQTNDLRTRMLEHYNNPPIIGVTHFFAEAIATEEQ